MYLKLKVFAWIIVNQLYYLLHLKIAKPVIDINKADKVAFVAHPDDEIVFMSRQILDGSNWLIICITNGANIVRFKEFTGLMKELKIQYQIWNFPDGLDVKWKEKKLIKEIKRIVQLKPEWKMIMTHNMDGEYGHFQHKQLSRIVRKTYEDENLYVPIRESKLVNEKYRLTSGEAENKIQIIKKFYKSQIEVLGRFKDYFVYEDIVKYEKQ